MKMSRVVEDDISNFSPRGKLDAASRTMNDATSQRKERKGLVKERGEGGGRTWVAEKSQQQFCYHSIVRGTVGPWAGEVTKSPLRV